MTQPPDAQKNFLVVDAKTETSTIEQAFDRYTHDRNDIGILLINQHVQALPRMTLIGIAIADYQPRLLREFDIEWIRIQTLFPQCSKYLAKTIHTIPRRIVYYEGSEDCSASDEMNGILAEGVFW